MRIALVVYEGVLDDECEAFRSVLGLLRDVEFMAVGRDAAGEVGLGGVQRVDATFDDVDRADVVIVPGGLGCERAADDRSLRDFLHRMERSARYVAASSTGTVVLASAGLLHGQSAATHWLAGDLLRRYGSESDERSLVVTGNIITCEGRISAVDAAFTLVERIEGSAAVDRIRATLLERGQPLLREPRWWEPLAERVAGYRRRTGRPATSPTMPSAPPTTPLSVMVELVDNDELARRLKRTARRRDRGS
jgi:putative intracellular protease/amidase